MHIHPAVNYVILSYVIINDVIMGHVARIKLIGLDWSGLAQVLSGDGVW